ncbi:MAG: enoyl-CoA hydratase-related protein [Planctomycetota bacterium]|nr:enoyl-CoA hydratase-related protein [Planctomycetota bacterium]
MNFENLLWSEKEGVAFVTINRPDKLNALNDKTLDELEKAFTHVRDNDALKAAILTGAGEKAFVAGADIGELAKLDPLGGKRAMQKGQRVLSLIENLGKPVVAAVNGFALGGGCELAMACAFRFAAENAKFGQPEVNLGIIPGYGGTQRLSRLVGRGIAAELILTGAPVDAAEALRIGLVNRVFPQKDLLVETEKTVRIIMAKGPLAVRFANEAIGRGLDMTLAEGLNLESNLFGLLCATKDAKTGLNAFLEKKKPEFQGA